MSGGRSSSQSSSSNSNVTDNSNTQINDTEGLVLNLEGAEDNQVSLVQTDQGAVQSSFEFATDALDDAFVFGSEALQTSEDFGRDVIQESQETTRRALKVAGNAQTNAFKKIQEIGQAFTGTAQSTRTIVIAIGIGLALVGGVLFFTLRKKT